MAHYYGNSDVKTNRQTSYSQYQEDLLLEEYFLNQDTGTCVEVGCFDGVTFSTTYLFEKRGWKCVLIEPNPLLHEKIESVRKSKLYKCAASNQAGFATLHIAEGIEELSTIGSDSEHMLRVQRQSKGVKTITVSTRTLNEILLEEQISKIDFISIDVEGFELNVLKGFSLERWRPKIVILEDNTNFRDETIRKYLKQFGYVRFRRTGCNDWYAKKGDNSLIGLIPFLHLHLIRIRFRSVYWLKRHLTRTSSNIG